MSMPEPASYSIALLGGFVVRGGPTPPRLSFSACRLIAYVALHSGVSRHEVADALWPRQDEPRALSNLRTTLWRIRAATTGLLSERGILLLLDDAIPIDWREALIWAEKSLADSLSQDSWPPVGIAQELLPGWGDAWLSGPREEFRLLQAHALEAAATRRLYAGRLGEACRLAMLAVRVDPLRESANRLLIEVHIREGNYIDAWRRYARYSRDLTAALGLQPSTGMQVLMAGLSSRSRGDVKAFLRRL